MKGKSGFTLIEIVIVAAVTVTLSAIFITYGGGARSSLVLATEQAKIAEVITRSRSLSISTFADTDAPCGYGVWRQIFSASGLPDNIYYLFRYRKPTDAERTNGLRCDPESNTGIYAKGLRIPQIDFISAERFILPSNIKFDTSERLSFILFLPPAPTVRLYEAADSFIDVPAALAGGGKIRLMTRDGSKNIIIEVNESGQLAF